MYETSLFFVKQKTAYEMRISDWSSDVCSSDLAEGYEVGGNLARIEQQIAHQREMAERLQRARDEAQAALAEIGGHIHGDEARLQVLEETIADATGRAAWRGRGCE